MTLYGPTPLMCSKGRFDSRDLIPDTLACCLGNKQLVPKTNRPQKVATISHRAFLPGRFSLWAVFFLGDLSPGGLGQVRGMIAL